MLIYKVIFLCLVVLVASVVGQREMWDQMGRSDSSSLFSFRVALPQSNLDILEKTLLDVSSPRSPNYGQWWTLEKIQDLVAPKQEVTNRVIAFFSSHNNMTIVNYRDSLKVTGLVQDVEQIFQTKLYNFMHKNEYAMIMRAVGGYTIPSALKGDVELVAGLLEFPEYRKQALRSVSDKVNAGEQAYVVPAVINNLYQIPDNFPVHPDSTLCLAEFQADQAILTSDLANFTTGNAISPINITKIVGAFNGTNTESSLDVEYGAAIAQKAPIWYWTEATWMYEFAVDLVGTPNPPLIVSMSWGWPEPRQCEIDSCDSDASDASELYVAKTNVEFQKAGLLGISLLAASGDQGAPGDSNPDCSFLKLKKLSTIFPGASPWVLSVGATMLSGDTTQNFPLPPICKQYPCTNFTTEEVCTYPEALITTGGGFSDYVPVPDYQKSVVNTYLTTSGAQLPPYKYFNMSNRGFPDVSALGHNYLIIMDGQWFQVDGTSCSTPVWGGIISLLNSYRLNNNKAPLGFIVPLIYEAYASDPTIFTDITTGNNKCTESCCDHYGYEAAKGWDPVTGLGTPVFPKLLKYIASLP